METLAQVLFVYGALHLAVATVFDQLPEKEKAKSPVTQMILGIGVMVIGIGVKVFST